MSKLSRDEALQWCVENVKSWEKTEVSHNILYIEDNWVFVFDGSYLKMVNTSDKPDHSITKQDWLEAKKNKEKEMNNNELMMKAAVKYKGVWPVDRNTFLAVRVTSMPSIDKGVIASLPESFRFSENWKAICTREQFESFVESIFESAPDEAEMYVEIYPSIGCPEYKGFAYKNDSNRYELTSSGKWIDKVDVEIARPTKKLYIGDTPQQLKEGIAPKATAYMPKVGEECLCDWADWTDLEKVKFKGSFDGVAWIEWFRCEGDVLQIHPKIEDVNFRPIKTEHDKLLDSLVNRMINYYGNPKGAEGYIGLAEAILNDEDLSIISVSNQK